MSTEDSQLLQNLPPELWNRMQTMVLAMLQEQKPAMVAPIATNTVDQSLSDSVDQSPVMVCVWERRDDAGFWGSTS
ncbi:hypothetical protein Pst134EA_004681 [Puccinia striiformis f. sp. tritici]|uniref:uncharacterized protein n=1 Tax=Puccinia striiformis f. sp. tritici TaxID=168172 RepID=UPI000A127890|nr:uncharacterized protein Pst134EA_032162 [Puccinia striiformis f. sp. tritici]XP_047810210.1 hypothetical protein Pst134EA_004681 [Puccinia striiformis f. sp. tritici]KAH9441859.1 hypothetical protein Pst134EA_032162 [Puccinia striiformis f. sp. tritici]KAH9470756.1 hypothetical protein Pst134EA_004681 [Puccinia striiformis f. sp. tritici]